MKLAPVETIYETNGRDIAGMLRQAASNLEAEAGDGFVGAKATRAIIAVQVTEGNGTRIYGWGRTDTLHSIAALDLGKAKLLATMIELDDTDDE